jgi:hypothetical protein
MSVISVKSVKRGFNFSTRTLLRDAQLLLGALQDGQVGPPILDNLSATFVVDFTAQIALVAKLSSDQRGAVGSMSARTQAQTQAEADLFRLGAAARRAARFAFAGQDTILHSEFHVGQAPPKTQAAALEQGRNVLAACQKYATELAPFEWSAAKTTQLGDAVAALVAADEAQETATGGKVGLTSQRITAANRLYQQCISVQSVVRLLHPPATAADDAATVEARQRFLLDVFPPRKGATTPVAPTAPVGVLPTAAVGPVEHATTVVVAPASRVAA